jgi:hypothetical protein
MTDGKWVALSKNCAHLSAARTVMMLTLLGF